MQAGWNEKQDGSKRKTIAYLFGLFIAVMLLLTLFSNTMLAMTLPKVITEKPRKAKLQHTIEGSGRLVPQEEAELKNTAGLKLRESFVKEGDVVKQGQTLILFDNEDAKRQLLDEQARLKQMQLTLDRAKDQYIAARQEENEMAVREAKRSLESQMLDIDVQERKIQSMQEKIAEQERLKAPFDGVIVSFLADEQLFAVQGQLLIRITNPAKGYRLEISISEPSAWDLKEGDKVPIRIEGDTGQPPFRQIEGQIAAIEAVGQSGAGTGGLLSADGNEAAPKAETPQVRLVISVQGEGLRPGAQANIHIVKSSDKETLLLSNSVIKEDGEGSYVFTVLENKGPLGNTFTVKKSYIRKLDSNDKETAIERGLAADDRIIVETSEPLQEGNRVRLN